MENLKLARIFLYFGLTIGASVPIFVIINQGIASDRRKQGIKKDRERIQKKLEENPDLKFRTEGTHLPISENQLDSILNLK